MKLKATYNQVKDYVPGAKAAIMDDVINGATLVIHSGNLVTLVKLSDLTELLKEQDKVDEPKEPVDETDS